ncbi:hypothetical protein HanPI659440_Chr08g0305451 [Helianthus annuus]|nr:hypothetical protein HanPI659440_Chr08g0305451 [Helianthus annuus]
MAVSSFMYFRKVAYTIRKVAHKEKCSGEFLNSIICAFLLMSQGVQGRKSATLIADFLEHYREVSMLDIKGADANKVILVIGIMTLHSFGEESGVGVSFAGSKGLSHGSFGNFSSCFFLRPIVAVPSFICADAFNKLLPFCTGFAAGCMIWIVVAEVLRIL